MSDEPEQDAEHDGSPTDRLDAAYATIERPVVELFRYTRGTRRLVWVFGASLIFDLVVTVVVALFAVKVVELASDTNDNTRLLNQRSQERARITCDGRNEFKRLDLIRWTSVLEIADVPPPGEKPRARVVRMAQNEKFRRLVVAADKPEDCDAYVASLKFDPPDRR